MSQVCPKGPTKMGARLCCSRYQIYSRRVETKNERFRRIAAVRGNRLIRELVLLGNLANTKNYEYSPEEVEQLFAPIEAELVETRRKFGSSTGSVREVGFE